MSICPVLGLACDCQPDEGIPCTATLENVVKGFHGWRNEAIQKGHRIAQLEAAMRGLKARLIEINLPLEICPSDIELIATIDCALNLSSETEGKS